MKHHAFIGLNREKMHTKVTLVRDATLQAAYALASSLEALEAQHRAWTYPVFSLFLSSHCLPTPAFFHHLGLITHLARDGHVLPIRYFPS